MDFDDQVCEPERPARDPFLDEPVSSVARESQCQAEITRGFQPGQGWNQEQLLRQCNGEEATRTDPKVMVMNREVNTPKPQPPGLVDRALSALFGRFGL
jgi:hypothetical protein